MGKKRKPKAMLPEGIDHEFEESLENCFGSKAIVVLTLDRRTGAVEIDATLSNPLEAWAMLATAQVQKDAEVDRAQGGD